MHCDKLLFHTMFVEEKTLTGFCCMWLYLTVNIALCLCLWPPKEPKYLLNACSLYFIISLNIQAPDITVAKFANTVGLDEMAKMKRTY